MGRESVVVIGTCYGLDGLGFESPWGEIVRPYPDRLWGPPSFLYKGYGLIPGNKAVGFSNGASRCLVHHEFNSRLLL